jgi:hypothetical protein
VANHVSKIKNRRQELASTGRDQNAQANSPPSEGKGEINHWRGGTIDQYSGGLTAEQHRRMDDALSFLRRGQASNGTADARNSSDLFSSGIIAVKAPDAVGENKNNPMVSFYAAGDWGHVSAVHLQQRRGRVRECMQGASAIGCSFHARYSDHVIDWREHASALPHARSDAEGRAAYHQRLGYRRLHQGLLARRTGFTSVAASRGSARRGCGSFLCCRRLSQSWEHS